MNKLIFSFFLTLLCTTFLLANPSSEEEFSVGIICPGDKWVGCDAEIQYLNIYGDAYFKDYYGSTFKLPEPEVQRFVSQCNTGHIKRTWRHKSNGKWFECTQTIYVGEDLASSDPTIIWPREGLVLEGCQPNILPKNLPQYYDEPFYSNAGCSMLVSSYKDQLFTISGGCKKIIRRWTVIDWCQYVPNSFPTRGFYQYFQTIQVINNSVPTAYETQMIEVNASSCTGAYVNVPDLVVGSATCDGEFGITNNSSFSDSNGANASGLYPVGLHTITYSVEFGCGSKTTFTQDVKVNNNLSPVPLCISGVSIALMPVDEDNDGTPENGSVLIWAKDFDVKSYHPCDLDLSFSFDAEQTSMSTEFTCANVGFNELDIFVTDSNGNQSFCSVGVLVQNNAANIPDCDGSSDQQEVEDDPIEADDPVEDTPQDTTVYLDMPLDSASVDMPVDPNAPVDTTALEVPVDTTAMDAPVDTTALEVPIDTSAMDAPVDTTLLDIPLDSMSVDSMEFTTMEPDTSVMEEQDTSSLGAIFGNMMSVDSEAISSGTLLFQTTGEATVAFSQQVDINSTGEYILTGLPMGQPIDVTASLDESQYTGNITTADGIILFEHLTGISRIQDPYRLIAADIDQDGDIDFDDVEFLVDYIAETTASLPADEWVFADANFAFANPTAPWSEDFIASSIELSEPVQNMNFIGIQIGDLGSINLESRSDIHTLRNEINRYLNKNTDAITISPNPFTNTFTVSVQSTTNQIATMKLFDMSGKLITNKTINLRKGNNDSTIDFSDNPNSGTMIYTITTDNQQFHGKIMRLK